MKILVAGGSGFIGTMLLPLLIQNGYQISMVVSLGKKHANIPCSVEVVEIDILDSKCWQDLIEKLGTDKYNLLLLGGPEEVTITNQLKEKYKYLINTGCDNSCLNFVQSLICATW